MEDIIKSLLGKTDPDYIESVSTLMTEEAQSLLSKQENEYLEYLVDTFMQSNQLPTEDYFLSKYPEYTNALSKAKDLNTIDFRVKVGELFNKRQKQRASVEIMNIASEVQSKGLNEDHLEKLRGLVNNTDCGDVAESVYDFSKFKDRYLEKKDQPTGMLTFVNAIDEKIGGLSLGTTNIIFAYVSQFKSTWGLNIAYNNTQQLGYNVAVISLEVPKDDMMNNFLCRHSFDSKFTKYPYIPHDKIRKCELDDEEENYLLEEVLPDFMQSKGKLFILDETDFNSFSFTEIRQKLEKLDDLARQETGSGLDGVIWDHAHLFKFTEGMRGLSDGAIINLYVSFIRKLSIKFRKLPDGTYSQLSNIILAQSNRKGWEMASKGKGRYNLTALSEANELERAGYRIMSIWTNENLKESKEATVQLLKNRSGPTMWEPTTVYADGEAYVFGDESEGFDEMISTDDLGSVFDSDDGFGIF